MANPNDRQPPLPYIPALDPGEFEKAWDDAPRLLAALNGARLGAWYWDVESGRVSWSRGAQALFGLDPKQPLLTQVDYIELIPQEERSEVLQLFQQVLDGSPSTRAFRHRIRWPDASLHWIEISGSLQQDADGKQRVMGVLRDITAQQEREQALHNSQQRFTNLFQLSPDVVLLVRFADSVITEANQHFESTFGWPAAEVIGRSTLELALWVHSEQRDFLRLNAPTSRDPVVQEVRLRTRDGRILDGMLSSQYIDLDGEAFLLTTFLDTSERKRAEMALSSSEEKFSQAFLHTPDAMVITEKASGRFIEVNPSFVRQFGWNNAEAVGRTSLELGLWAEQNDRQRMLDALQHDRLNQLEVRLHSRDGSVSHNLLFGGEIELDGCPCLVLTVRNITQQRIQEQALKDSQERLTLALDSANLGTWD
jgi:PAS domain S-box-containing protein